MGVMLATDLQGDLYHFGRLKFTHAVTTSSVSSKFSIVLFWMKSFFFRTILASATQVQTYCSATFRYVVTKIQQFIFLYCLYRTSGRKGTFVVVFQHSDTI